MIRAGSSWCDLVKHADGRVEVVRLQGTVVVCDDADSGARRWAVETGHARLYLRAAADGAGRVLAAGQGEDRAGTVRTTIDASIGPDLGGTAFPFSVLVRGESDGWTVFIQRTGTSYDAVRLASDGRVLSTTPHAMPHTSQGFLYLGNDGDPVFSDAGDDRITGLWLPTPSEDGTVWAAQSHTENSIALFDTTTGRITHLGTHAGQPPHIVQRGDEYFVCAYVHEASWWERYRRPFAGVTPPAQPPPVTPPPVDPQPPQEGLVRLEEKHSRLIEEYAARFGMPGLSHAAGQEWIKGLAETFAARWPNEGWGRKSAGGGRPISNESLARKIGGDADRDGRSDIVSYDLIRNAGASNQELVPHAHPEDIDDQDFHPVTPRDHLAGGGGTPPTQPPPVTPPPAGRPFPAPRWPEDVFLHALTRYINEGLYERDKPVENPEGSRTASRGALMWFVPIATEKLIARIAANGNQLPNPAQWWQLADEVANAAIDFYRRTAPPE